VFDMMILHQLLLYYVAFHSTGVTLTYAENCYDFDNMNNSNFLKYSGDYSDLIHHLR